MVWGEGTWGEGTVGVFTLGFKHDELEIVIDVWEHDQWFLSSMFFKNYPAHIHIVMRGFDIFIELDAVDVLSRLSRQTTVGITSFATSTISITTIHTSKVRIINALEAA